MSEPRALVVFEHRSSALPLRLLRPGYRHCFCLVRDGTLWSLCDPLKSRIVLRTVSGLSELDLLKQFAAPQYIVLRGLVAPDSHGRHARLRAVTCVEVVKRVLNLDLPWVVTPYQLYCRLLHLPAPLTRFEPVTHSNWALDSMLE
jgi:hypothetical protein